VTSLGSTSRFYLLPARGSRGEQRHERMNADRIFRKPWAFSPAFTCDASCANRVMIYTTDEERFPYFLSMKDQREAEQRNFFESQWPGAQPIVRKYIMGLIGRRGAIDEIVQEVAYICLRRIATFDKNRSFTAWAIGIARLEVFTHRRQQVLLSIDHFPDLEMKLSDAEENVTDFSDLRQRALTLCLERLTDNYQKFIDLRYGKNQSHEDMAEHLGMSIIAIKVSLTRIRAQLRECVEHRLSGTSAP
jgi:RNA polymerase sigma-70 factor, ECF subfamily